MEIDSLDEIIKLLRDELSDIEKEQFFKKIEYDLALRELFIEQKNLWVKTGVKSVLSVDERISDFEQIWKKVTPNKSNRILIRVFRYAAVILLSLMLGGIIGYTSLNKHMGFGESEVLEYSFVSGTRSMSEVTLPDGSLLILNADSKITFRHDPVTNNRIATLVGEASFDVKHNEDSPFIIDFGKLKILDVGTIFNVRAYEEEGVIETSLVEGAVDVLVNDKEVTSLTPGQKAVFNRISEKVNVNSFDLQRELAWMRNRFSFENVPLIEVMTELGEWYGVKVIWQNKTYQNKKLHINMKRSNSIESMMKMIKMSANIEYDLIHKSDEKIEITIK
ncbi:MAG: DUF4974 domain-containing protein [Carboxylicivirga sp.]|jgi:ferric-dicitrate binding protein FerR (iron transport regulator)|nr:DUF4974 domain-containing protein [Carboxylicivirga sp.]